MARATRTPYRSGLCATNPHPRPCPGQFKNGAAAKNPIALCSCECHGDYEARLQSLGIVPAEPEEEEDDDA